MLSLQPFFSNRNFGFFIGNHRLKLRRKRVYKPSQWPLATNHRTSPPARPTTSAYPPRSPRQLLAALAAFLCLFSLSLATSSFLWRGRRNRSRGCLSFVLSFTRHRLFLSLFPSLFSLPFLSFLSFVFPSTLIFFYFPLFSFL